MFARALVVALAVASGACAAPGVRIEHAAARVAVIVEDRRDVSVSVAGGDRRLPPLRTRVEGDVIVVDGGLGDRMVGCGAINWNVWAAVHHVTGSPAPGQRVNIRGVGFLALDHLPSITVRAPRRVAVAAEGAMFGHVGAAESLSLTNAGCGDWRIQDVDGTLNLSTSGSGNIGGGRAGSLHAQLAGSSDVTLADVARDVEIARVGSGDVRLARVGGALSIKVAGSGDVSAAEANGAITVAVNGSGDVAVGAGHAPRVAVQIAGSGGFTFKGEAGSLTAQIAGSGDVHVTRVTGRVTQATAGSGEVTVGGR